MKNYFFVHTATQLVIAQHIAQRFYADSNNYIIFGNTGANVDSLNDILNRLCNNDIWCGKSWIGDLHDYIPSLSSLKNWKRIKSCLNSFKDISSSSFFFGDIGHVGYLNFAKYFEKKEGKINFFEEGLSHYSERLMQSTEGHAVVLFMKRNAHYLLSNLFFGTDGIGIYVFNNKRVGLNLKIENRYNLLQRKDWQKYDVRINFDDIFKESITSGLITGSLEKLVNKPCALFLTSTSRNFSKQPIEQELQIIKIVVQNIKVPLLYKFHPKDNENFRKAVTYECNKLNHCVIFIDNDYPAELLFGALNVVGIYSYGSSAHLYFLSSTKRMNFESSHVYEIAQRNFPNDLSRFDWLLKYYNSWNSTLKAYKLDK